MPDPSLDTTRVLNGYILHFRIRLLSLWFSICSFAVQHTKTPMQAVLLRVPGAVPHRDCQSTPRDYDR